MRGATDSREMILNGNETAPLFENFLKGKFSNKKEKQAFLHHSHCVAELPPKGKPLKEAIILAFPFREYLAELPFEGNLGK